VGKKQIGTKPPLFSELDGGARSCYDFGVYFDALTMAAVADELREKILGGRVQKVLLPDDLSVGLEVYSHGRRHYLLASAHPQHARVHLVGERLRRGVEKPTPLLLLLRKYVRHGRIAAIEQPSLERVLRIEVEHPQGDTSLIIEVMGRHSNIVLVAADGAILDSVKRIGPNLSRYRTILPQRPYVPPPPQAKLDPTDVTELRLREMLSAAPPDEPLWRALVRGIRGVSPLLAREVAYRATGNAEALASQVTAISPLLDTFREMLIPVWEHRWQPTVAKSDDRLLAFAPYPLTQFGTYEKVASISQAVEAYYREVVGEDAYAAAKKRVREAIAKAREQLRRKRESLQRALTPTDKIEELRLKGEMILAYAHRIAPGQRKLMVDQPPLAIELDPRLSPAENARAYFAEYRKAKRAAEDIPALLERAELEMRYLDQLEADLDLAANWPEVEEVKAALAEGGYIREERRRRKAGRSEPLAFRSSDGLLILVGKNSRQNEEVTFRRAAPDDLWLHARDVPGAHVVVKAGGREVPQATLRQAAQLAAYYSQARGEAKVAVDYTLRRHVRRLKGAGRGMVTYKHERTIVVKPALPDELRARRTREGDGRAPNGRRR